jgi:F-type H+-transporting ATPase subunit epsilon
MMSDERQTFRLLVATFNENLFDGAVTYVELPGLAGHVGVLKHHTPLLTLLADGPLTLHPADGPPRVLPVMGGIAEAAPWGVTVLADFAGHGVAAEKQRMDAARGRSAARQPHRPPPNSPAARARLSDALNMFLIRALRDLRR